MPIEMPKGLPFSVDTFTVSSSKKRHHFLTHAHRDHTSGISPYFSPPIYATHLTKTLVLQQYPQLDDSSFVGIEVGQSMILEDRDGDFTVTAFDANHCPGAVMFLFEGSFGNILHTGDCRLTPECLFKLPDKYIGKKGKEPRHRLDYIFLDCTFGRFLQKLPSKGTAIQQVINCIWEHPGSSLVYLTCDLLGQEEILEHVAKTFGSKIYVDKIAYPASYQSLRLLVPDILSDEPLSRFQLLDGFPKLYERAKSIVDKAKLNFQPEPLIIRASAQWYACDDNEHSGAGSRRKMRFNEAVKDQFDVWHACYSMHSSREELEWGLQLLAPKRVVSTTPGCWAMELDYVKKHCFGAKIAVDDPLWKLLDINVEASPQKSVDSKGLSCCPTAEKPTHTTLESEFEPEKLIYLRKDLLALSPLRKRKPVTLFGRARDALHDSDYPLDRAVHYSEMECRPVDVDETQRTSGIQEAACTNHEDVIEVELGAADPSPQHDCLRANSLASDDVHKSCVIEVGQRHDILEDVEVNKEIHIVSEKAEIDVAVRQEDKLMSSSRSLSLYPSLCTRGYSDSFRKLYWSMNAPMPKPLPSLVKLRNSSASKRARRLFE